MGWILRSKDDTSNPTLSGGVYYVYITIGKPVYWRASGSNIVGIILIADGGKYGLDSVSAVEYKGAPLTANTEWKFHRGTFSSQIAPIAVTADDVNNKFTNTGTNPFADNDKIRFRAIEGYLPRPIAEEINGQSEDLFVVNRLAGEFQVSLTSGGAAIDLLDNGTGSLIAWKADKGYDDADQGLPFWTPEVENTFNNISYIEFNHNFGSTTEPPDWQDFRIFGVGRRLMDYDASGVEQGVVDNTNDLLGNPALITADNYLWNHKGDPARIHWASWFDLRTRSEVEILYRVNTTDTATVNGLTGRYYGNDDFTNLIVSRLDAEINIPDTLPTTPPITGVDGHGFSVIWKGQMTPRYSELYTLKFIIDDDVEFFIDGQSVLHATTVGTHTVQYNFVADQAYEIEIRFRQIFNSGIGNHYRCEFKWSSSAQAEEIVPQSRLFPSDEIVKRYRISLAFNQPTESAEVHERVMERTVGWAWTDKSGLIQFLPPDRDTVFTFSLDRLDDDSVANFTHKSFEKKRRALNERENFKLGRFRNLLLDLYPFQFVQADREELRRFTNGEPSNSPFIDIGVTSQSQAQRFLEMEMVLKTDPDHLAEIVGRLAASGIRKCEWIKIYYVDEAGEVANQKYEVTFHAWGDAGSRHQFSLLPIPENASDFYSDEPIE